VSRLDGVVKGLENDLTEVRRRVKSLEQDILRRDDQIAQLNSELRVSRDENMSKVDEVSIKYFTFLIIGS